MDGLLKQTRDRRPRAQARRKSGPTRAKRRYAGLFYALPISLAVYLSAVAVSLVAIVLGAAICRVLRVAGWLAPALGLSAAMVLALAAVRLPGKTWAAVAALATALVVAAVVLGRGGIDRRDVRVAAAAGIPVAVILLAACSLPFVAYGDIGELGPGYSSDPFFHIGQADAMRSVGLDAGLITAGYPLGPHALVATLGVGLGIATEPVFLGLLLAIPVLAGLTALAGLGDLAPGRRVVAAVLVGLPYLPASYFVQGSFKEPIFAACFLCCALVLRDAPRLTRPDVGALAAIALATAGGAVAFGWPALAWPAAMLVVYGLLAGSKDAVQGQLRRWGTRRRLVWVGAFVTFAAVVLAVAAEASGFFDGAGQYLFTEGTGGNFAGQLSPFEAVGTWPASDFRYRPEGHPLVFSAVVAFGAVVAAWGVAWCWRRGERALMAAAIAAMLIYAIALPFTLAYNSGKALVVLAPVLTLITVRALFTARPQPARRTAPRRIAWAAIAVAFAAATAGSTTLALRSALPRPHEVANDLAALVPTLRGERTLYLGRSDWVGWDLHASRLSSFQGAQTPLAKRLSVTGSKARSAEQTDAIDIDVLPATLLDRFTYVLAPRTAYLSTLPGNFKPIRRTRWFVLWKREGPTAARLALDDRSAPGAVLHCDNAFIAALAQRGGVAFVRPRPVVGPQRAWTPVGNEASAAGARPAMIQPGGSLSQTLALGPGTWELALSHSSGVPLRLRAASLDAMLPPYAEDRSLLFAAGRIVTTAPRTRVRVEVTAADRSLADRWMEVGVLTATRVDDRGTLVPLRRACGRYVDWFRARP
jgi:hypothetical protein